MRRIHDIAFVCSGNFLSLNSYLCIPLQSGFSPFGAIVSADVADL